MKTQGRSLHFWTLRNVESIVEWDPDISPGRHASGWGHSFAEPYVRLRTRGAPVSVGPGAPANSIVVASLEELGEWSGDIIPSRAARLAAIALRGNPVVLVRNDYPLDIEVPASVSLELLPNRSSCATRPGLPMPPLPQRGLVRRDLTRGTVLESVALKSMPANLPTWLPKVERMLRAIEMSIRVDSSPDNWPDFSTVDVALCARRRHPVYDPDHTYLRKPPTKLVNAWVAGAIPVVFPEEPYLELVRPGIDGLVAESPHDVAALLGELRGDPDRVRDMQAAISLRAEDVGVMAVLDCWERLLRLPPRRAPRRVAALDLAWYCVRYLRG